MDKTHSLNGTRAVADTTGSFSSKTGSSMASITFTASGRSTNNSNSAAFSAPTAATTTPRASEQHRISSIIHEEDNMSSDMNEDLDFDKPIAKQQQQRRKPKSKAAKSGNLAALEDEDDGDEEDDDGDEEGGACRKRGGDADSVGSPKTPIQTPTPADPDVDVESGSGVKRKVTKQKMSSSAKLLMDKKRLEQYIGDGELLVPVPRARRRLKGGDLGYMVKKGDTVVRYIDKDGMVYNPFDTAYLQNREKGKPYFVCAIQKFNLTKRDTLMVGVKWFFRLSEVPGSVYHHLTLDRELHSEYPPPTWCCPPVFMLVCLSVGLFVGLYRSP
ncbi:Arginine-glutamic acid dipeptide (re) repeats a [Plakobranchus ocellatus]|uniref:Arginine-glutamic acid dipeptide (Re) repeats a n=1 Tax=Plakobranchus ocellatus TaxID=259542 RepID=A0AAV4DF36_9GAST|nr:Arginine-glutamic acid dipeptide (re) repeats a [Plakobranchus ocellatus]